jgi:hypothetical protein
MNYMEKVEAWLDGEIEKLLDSCQKKPFTEGMDGFAAFKKAVKDKLLESYRNGQKSVFLKDKKAIDGTAERAERPARHS